MEQKYIVKNYFALPEAVTDDLNKHMEKGYYPREINLEAYQDQVMGIVVFELRE